MAAARPDGAPLMPAALSRRQALRLGAGLGLAVPLATAWGRPAPAAGSLRLAAAWQQEDGGYRIGVLETRPGQSAPLKATHTLDMTVTDEYRRGVDFGARAIQSLLPIQDQEAR